MRRTCCWLALLVAQLSATVAPASAADSAQPQACIDVAKRSPDGTSSDRFLREWCQRNLVKSAEPKSPESDLPPPSQASDLPKVPESSAPLPESPVYPSYPDDSSYDGLNSSRLPPGYHCHMLKFGERICHGGLD